MLVVLLALVCLPLAVEGKVDQVRVRLGTNGKKPRTNWQYLGKFGFDFGQGTWSVKIKERFPQGIAPNTTFDVEIFLDEQWPEAKAEPDACKRRNLAKQVEQVQLGGRRSFGPEANGKVRQKMRPHVWYFAISDCNNTLGDNSLVMTAEFTALNPDNSHFSVEAKWTPSASLLTLIGCTAFLGYCSKKANSFGRDNGSVHPVIWTLLAVLITEYVALCLHTGHLQMYNHDGRGSAALETLSELLFVCCHIIQASLLILIASGYTLLQNKLGDLDVVVPVCFLVAIVHAMLVVLDKITADSSSKFTDHDGYKGYGCAFLRLGLFAWFFLATRSTSNAAGMRIRHFLRQFRVLGSFYFLSYPAMLLLTQILAPYVRKPIFEMGLMSSQVCSNIWLANLFLSRGLFFEASSLSASPLPGPTSSIRFFKDD